jgi:4-amino-4-deoxy-L-arabinose transferase-like glycosyltransferase
MTSVFRGVGDRVPWNRQANVKHVRQPARPRGRDPWPAGHDAARRYGFEAGRDVGCGRAGGVSGGRDRDLLYDEFKRLGRRMILGVRYLEWVKRVSLVRSPKWFIAIAIALYWVSGAILIAQKPGLQDDEALLVAGAVHMAHSGTTFELSQTPNSWICPFSRCIPLMSAQYVGAVKEYAVLPLFAWFGPRMSFIRIVSLILGTLGLWGIYRLVAEFFSVGLAALTAFVIAVSPAFVNMTVFDNNAVGAAMAGLGLSCACLARYHQRKGFWAAFALGVAMGFGVWARANFVWVLIAGFAAGLIVFRRQLVIPAAHWLAVFLGGVVGGFPFLMFQIISGGATWKAREALSVTTPMGTLLRDRIFWFADMLISDGEHRQMWLGPPLPQWQLWFFPLLVIAACFVCLSSTPAEAPRRRSFARAVVGTFFITGTFLLFSKLPIAEHHLIILFPLTAVTVVVACSFLETAFPKARTVSITVFLIYISSAIYWQIAGIRGLNITGGAGMWSDAGLQLARYCDQRLRGQEIKLLDWGLEYNMYVLTDGRLRFTEIYRASSEDRSFEGRPWADEIRDGGIFVLNGPENRSFPKPSAGFLHALAVSRPIMREQRILQRNGETYAEILEITPNSIRGPAAQNEEAMDRIDMGDLRFENRLTGFYPPEEGRFRWTSREFSTRVDVPALGTTGGQLLMHIYIPENVIQKLGSITLHASFAGHALAPQTWSEPGSYVYRRELDANMFVPGSIQINFSLNKSIPPSSQDKRELGIIVQELSIEPL